jgi:GT2 family glycosyltransferase
MSNKTASIIIVTTAKEGYFKQCLDSVNLQSYPDKEIIIIDNSGGNLPPEIREGPGQKVYPGAGDMSYCRSLNKGIEISSGDFILCLNDDAVLEKRFIEEAMRGFSIDPRIGMVSGKVLRFDKRTLDSTGLFLTVFRTPRERGYGKSDTGKFEKEEYVFGVGGAVAFYRRSMLEGLKVGAEYFDPDFGYFYEDLDIAWRAENSGWKGYYIPRAVAYHLRGGTARPQVGRGKRMARRYLSEALHYDLLKNRYLAIIKNDSLPGFLLNLPFIVLYDIASWGFVLLFRPQLIKMVFSKRIPFTAAFRKRKILRSKK